MPVPFTTAEQLQTPVISSSGAITFWSAGPGCPVSEGLYRWHRGRLTPIVEVPCSGPHPSGIFAIDNEHDQNAGGDVAVIGAIDSNGTQNRLFVFRRGTAVGIAGPAECPSINNGGDVVSSDDGVTSSACPSLNDPGELAYSTGSEIRTTEGPSQQHVIGIGDGLSGSTISSLFQLRPHSLNNRGDIVFAVELADGRQAVVVASKQ